VVDLIQIVIAVGVLDVSEEAKRCAIVMQLA
jgi:hypothetical protein